jgi:ABC-type branched-subunit amino acid transport system ATPase component
MIESTNNQRSSISVLFGKRSVLDNPISENTVLIAPSHDNWNDFGFRTQVDILIGRIEHNEEIHTHGYLGFIEDKIDQSNDDIDILKLFSATKSEVIDAKEGHRFFTMLPDMESYRGIIRILGVEIASDVLLAINDIVAYEEFKPSEKWLKAATQTNTFNYSFMRSSETYFTYKNVGSLLRGLDLENLGKLSQTLSIKFQLPGRKNQHDLLFEFDHNATLPKRIAVVIGKNGVGKSQTLKNITQAALSGDEMLSEGVNGGRPLISRILAFAPTNEAESVFPSDRRKRARIWYRRFSLNRSRRSRSKAYISDLIVQLARLEKNIKDKDRWDIFLNSIEALSSPEQICLKTTNHNSPFVGLTDLRRGGEQNQLDKFATIYLQKDPVRVIDNQGYPLSSGEISFLTFAAQVSLHIENGSLLLLDEPETHLHPNFISRFVLLLDELLSQTGSSAIIATHSVYFLREVFREQIKVLREDDEHHVYSETPLLKTFGADIGAISYFVFGEDAPSKLTAEVEDKVLALKMPWEELYELYKDELSSEVLASIRSKLEAGEDS